MVATAKGEQCKGGRSYNCRHDTHVRAKRVYNCHVCKVYLGCAFCCEISRELLCLNCHDWGTLEALKAHGPMVQRVIAARN